MNEEPASISRTGGVWTSIGSATWPLAEIEFFPNAIRLTCLGNEFVFPRSSVIRLTRWRGLCAIGFRIRHNVPYYPRFIVFWAYPCFYKARFEQFREQLEALGYEMK